MTIQLPTGVTPEMAAQLIDNPGQTVSNGLAQSTSIKASRSVDISTPAGKEIRPQIGGHVAGAEKITVSSNLAAKLAAGDELLRAEAARLKAEELELAELSDMERINARLCFLERANKKLVSQLNKLTKEEADDE